MASVCKQLSLTQFVFICDETLPTSFEDTCVCLGACEGTLACSTCHLIFDEDVYKNLGRITDEEMDMLDLAYGLTET